MLLAHGYLSHEALPSRTAHGSIAFCRGLNVELTYRCQYRCPHCLQESIRDPLTQELSSSAVKTAINQAYYSGVCTVGINFTGGEPLGNRDDLFDIFRHTASLAIPFRLNTNCWWAGQLPVSICGREFNSPSELVAFLLSTGMTILAFSYDARYRRGGYCPDNLIAAIRACEEVGMRYQLGFTGMSDGAIAGAAADIRHAVGSRLRHMELIPCEMVDIGGARNLGMETFAHQENTSPCRGKGFYRPHYIHIAPDGKVRSCLYALQSGNVGNLTKEPLHVMLNRFPYSAGARIFSSDREKQLACHALRTAHDEATPPVRHECTANIVLSRMAEMLEAEPERAPADMHRQIARELNLDNSGNRFSSEICQGPL